MTDLRDVEIVRVDELKPHPRNYRGHPEEQVAQLARSIEEHGFYKNIVISSDGFTLAGHGAVEALDLLGLPEVTAVRMDFSHDDPRALKILAADNYLSHMAEDDDRMLVELLNEVRDLDDLYGTGFDEQMLEALDQITAPPDAWMKDFDPNEEWSAAGMPEYDPSQDSLKLVLHFTDPAERDKVVEELALFVSNRHGLVWSAYYPPVDGRADRSSLRFE